MTTQRAQPATGLPVINDFVSSDMLALASHMSDCERSRGRFFTLRSNLEMVQATASARIVTTAVVLAACSLGLMAFA